MSARSIPVALAVIVVILGGALRIYLLRPWRGD